MNAYRDNTTRSFYIPGNCNDERQLSLEEFSLKLSDIGSEPLSSELPF